MRWRRLWRSIKKYLSERVSLTLIPHTRGAIFGLRFPRFVLYGIILCLLGYIFSVTYLYRNYLDRFLQAQATIVALQELKIENVTLKAGLAQVAKETEKMRQVISELEKKGQHIEALLSNSSGSKKPEEKDLILFNYKLLDGTSVEEGQPLGGGSEYLETDGFEILGQIREELMMLRAEVPIYEDTFQELHDKTEEKNALKMATPTGWPIRDKGQAYISSDYGFRRDPVSGQQAFHEGLDLALTYGTPVTATASGRVTYSGWKTGYGRIIIIDHGYGYQTRYAHNSRLVVEKGTKVNRGTLIAYSGNSGKSTGPHVHYEVRVNGIPKNPWTYMKAK